MTIGSLLQRMEGREHWFDQVVVLKVLSSDFEVEPMRYADGLDVGFEGEPYRRSVEPSNWQTVGFASN